MILIPLQSDGNTIALGFRKADMFVFIDKDRGIVLQENHYKHDKSALFFENFIQYDIDMIYVKNLGYKSYLKLDALGIKVYLIHDSLTLEYTHIDPNNLIEITQDNAVEYCTMGHHKERS